MFTRDEGCSARFPNRQLSRPGLAFLHFHLLPFTPSSPRLIHHSNDLTVSECRSSIRVGPESRAKAAAHANVGFHFNTAVLC